MPLPDTIYCSQQINIPPELPDILKQFTKAAIRTQPRDVLQWAAAYFSALSKGEPLPVKDRLEMPVATQKTDTGLTPGLLKVLHKQLSFHEKVLKKDLQQAWKGLCLPAEQLEMLLELGNFSTEIEWTKFLALGCSALGGTIISALRFACEILTEDPEGGAARIPFHMFTSLYTYLAELDGDIPQDQIDSFLLSLQEHVTPQEHHRSGTIWVVDHSQHCSDTVIKNSSSTAVSDPLVPPPQCHCSAENDPPPKEYLICAVPMGVLTIREQSKRD